MKTKILFLVLGVVIGAGATTLFVQSKSFEPISVYIPFDNYIKLDTGTSISCTFPQMISAYYKDGQIEHTLPKPELNPIVFTFSDFNREEGLASLSYIDATRTVSTVPLAIMFEDEDKIVLIENGGESYLTSHTIFKKHGVAIYSKQILLPFLEGIPSGTTAMGTCR